MASIRFTVNGKTSDVETEAERPLLAEYFQRCFDIELPGLFVRSA